MQDVVCLVGSVLPELIPAGSKGVQGCHSFPKEGWYFCVKLVGSGEGVCAFPVRKRPTEYLNQLKLGTGGFQTWYAHCEWPLTC